jgi:hypothetical protein
MKAKIQVILLLSPLTCFFKNTIRPMWDDDPGMGLAGSVLFTYKSA